MNLENEVAFYIKGLRVLHNQAEYERNRLFRHIENTSNYFFDIQYVLI